jgi:hypothetical protein
MREQKEAMPRRERAFQIVFAKVQETPVNSRCKIAGLNKPVETRSTPSKLRRQILHLPSLPRTLG